MVESFDHWSCLTCPDNPEFTTRAAAIQHIIDKHGYIKGTPAKKDFKLHLDYRPGYESHYEWDFGTFKLYQKMGVR